MFGNAYNASNAGNAGIRVSEHLFPKNLVCLQFAIRN